MHILLSTRGPTAGFLLAGCLVLLPLQPAEAQVARAEDVVKVTPALPKTGFNPGEIFQAALIIDILDGYHLNAHTLTNPSLIATEIELPEETPVAWPYVRYPEDLAEAGTEVPGLVGEEYHKRVVIRLVGRLPEDAEVGELKAVMRLAYQTCTETFCLLPTSIPVEFTIPVVAPGTEVKEINPEIFNKTTERTEPPPPPL